MSEIKMTIKTILAYMNMNSEDFAKATGIAVNHLRSVMSGRAKMTAEDMIRIHQLTKIPYDSISVKQ